MFSHSGDIKTLVNKLKHLCEKKSPKSKKNQSNKSNSNFGSQAGLFITFVFNLQNCFHHVVIATV